MKHIVFFSSGIGSWAAAKRVAQEHGPNNLILLFADTGIEDADNYRFLEEAAKNIGGELIKVRSNRDSTVFDNWRSRSAIANDRMPFCSLDMKHKPCRDWLMQQDPIAAKWHRQLRMDRPRCPFPRPTEPKMTFYVGISWDEIHRLPAIERGWQPWAVKAPLTEPPYLDKQQMLNWANSEGLNPPRLYEFGLAHSNCGGGCVRAGQAHWAHILKVLPQVFSRWEAEEEEMRRRLQKDVSILSRREGGQRKTLTLRQLREEVEADGQIDLFDWGGCGCFAD